MDRIMEEREVETRRWRKKRNLNITWEPINSFWSCALWCYPLFQFSSFVMFFIFFTSTAYYCFWKIGPTIAKNINAHQSVNFRYCNQYVDKDALIYLILANEMLHDLHPDIITIAEDVSFFSLTCIYFHINILLGLRYAVW